MATVSEPRSALSTFSVSPDRGFLPYPDAVDALPHVFAAWDEIAADLPKLLVAGRVRCALDDLPVLDGDAIEEDAHLRRAMLVLSYFGHAYVWGEPQPALRLPPGISVPWYRVARRLGRPPVLSYASYALDNWRRLDPSGPIALGNIVLRQDFLGGLDEEWFILVHVDIEAKAGRALEALMPAQRAAADGRAGELEAHVLTIAGALEQMYATLLRMPEGCDPYVYFHRVRPYIHGWKDNPAAPEGLVYAGVPEYADRPQQFRGETGAQSSIVPALDAVLGVRHEEDRLRQYLREMRDYMPLPHREFIETLEAGSSVREAVKRLSRPSLSRAYDRCLELLGAFRAKHLEYAALYIQHQSQRSASNPTAIGTGGTPFMPYLKKHLTETERHKLER